MSVAEKVRPKEAESKNKVVSLQAHRLAQKRHEWSEPMIADPYLSARAKHIGMALLTFINRSKGYAWCSREEIAGAGGCCVRTVSRGLKELEESGWVTKEKRTFQGRCEYQLRLPNEDNPVPIVSAPKRDNPVPPKGTDAVPIASLYRENTDTIVEQDAPFPASGGENLNPSRTEYETRARIGKQVEPSPSLPSSTPDDEHQPSKGKRSSRRKSRARDDRQSDLFAAMPEPQPERPAPLPRLTQFGINLALALGWDFPEARRRAGEIRASLPADVAAALDARPPEDRDMRTEHRRLLIEHGWQPHSI